MNHSEINFDRVEQIIKQEVSLFVKLLKYLNSAFIGLTTKIDSIKQAITLLGEQPLRKWVSLLVMIQLGHDKPTQLIRTTLVRARFCEVIGAHASIDVQSLDLFLVGLLSTMDAFLDRALDEGLIDMPVSIDIKTALFGAETSLGHVLSLVIACEHGDTAAMTQLAAHLKIDETHINNAYLDAIKWSEQVVKIA